MISFEPIGPIGPIDFAPIEPTGPSGADWSRLDFTTDRPIDVSRSASIDCRVTSEATCQDCVNAVQPGVFAVKPLIRKWRYYLPEDKTKYILIERKQFPLMPAPAVALYSMQGTTADPGMVAYWLFPQRCTDTIKWLIVYVILSRPRSLAQLKSVGLSSKVREIIEQGPPEDLVANFKKLFQDKIEATAELARKAAQQYSLLPGYC